MGKRKRSTTRFLRIGEEVYKSAAWRALPDSAVRLWLDLRTIHNGSNNGRIAPTFATLRPLGWTSKDKLGRALALLLARGFLSYTRRTGPNAFHRAALVRFTDIPCPDDEARGIDGCGPTWDFLKWGKAPQSDTRPPFFAVPARRGGTAPPDGEQPPRETGNGSAEPPRQTGNAAKPDFHRENEGPDDVARRSPSRGEDIGLAIPTGDSSAPEHDAPLILRQTDLTRQAAMRKAARGRT